MKQILVIAFLLKSALVAYGNPETILDLTGPWHFALDPVNHGEKTAWHTPVEEWDGARPHPPEQWDRVDVPHDFLTDPRYGYTGTAWYRRSVHVPAEADENLTWRLRFATVFQRCRVWVNGTLVGEHEGGYTPFEFNVTEQLTRGRYNFIVVEVNNDIRFRALPGARTPTIGREGWPNSKMYAWLNYGGILGDVHLTGHSPVYIRRQTVRTELNETMETASIEILVTVQNDTAEEIRAVVAVDAGEDLLNLRQEVSIGAGSEQTVRLHGEVPKDTEWALWELDNPVLYSVTARVESDAGQHWLEDRFGIRIIETRNGRLYLNGEVVRLPGANRTKGHPVHGGRDPAELIAHDLTLMKAANLRFTRIQHTPPSKSLLRWADEQGFLLILEVGMWGYTAPDQASRELREQFQFEMKQMIQATANHPSVIGWSLGNEYESWLPEGIAWTRDMAGFVREIDPTRLVTFNTLGTALRELDNDPGGEHAFDYIDIITLSSYFAVADLPSFIDPVNSRWPDKPVFLGEYGRRADQFEEEDRIAHFEGVFAFVRERPWICGFSYWAFNDYQSRYAGSGMDGYRRWGLVDEYRTPRSLFFHMMQSFRQQDWMTSHSSR
jgi:beta-glucuronidase